MRLRALGRDGGVETLELPASHASVFRGVKWGSPYEAFTPSYWKAQVWFEQVRGVDPTDRLADSLLEEVAACLLGGYGMPAELGLAAFAALRDAGLIDGRTSAGRIEAVLRRPLPLRGRAVRYRFPRTKSLQLAAALRVVATSPPPVQDDVELRRWLLRLPGVGLKTASWIVRNHLSSDRVAVIDIHVFRALELLRLAPVRVVSAAQYLDAERTFLGLAGAIGVRPARLDAAIWREMRSS